MNLPPFLTQDARGDIRLTGHRIGLLHVVEFYKDGLTVEALAEHFPTLPPALIQQVIDFYLTNRAEVDAYVGQCVAAIDRQQAAAARGPSLEELQRRLAARGQSEKS